MMVWHVYHHIGRSSGMFQGQIQITYGEQISMSTSFGHKPSALMSAPYYVDYWRTQCPCTTYIHETMFSSSLP